MDARTDGVTVDVAVVGAGLAGLAAAATAASAGRTVLLLDGHPGGGRAATDQVGRYRFNRGAHALSTTGPGRQVLRDLGVRVAGSPPALRGARARLGDRVGLAPGGAVSLARTDLLTLREKVVLGRLLAGVRRWRPEELAGLTAAEWFDDLGLEGTARHMLEMVTRVATYAADLDVVSADMVASQVRAALAGVEYLHHGWSTLVDGLTAACWDRGAHLAPSGPAAAADGGPLTGPGVDAKGSGPASGRPWPAGAGAEGSGSVDGRAWLAGADVERPGPVDGGAGADEGEEPGAAGGRVRRVVPEGGRVRVELEDGVVLARRVVVAAGAPGAAARLLPDGAAGWGSLGPAARIAGLDLGVREVPQVQVLFGLDRALYLSCHAPAASGLAPPGAASVQLMWYLRADEDPSPDEARATFTEHARLAGVDAGSAEEARYLHRMVAVSAQPTPATGGLRGRPTVTDSGVDGVLLAGDWIGPTGYLADASLVSGVAAARAAVEGIDREATTHPVSEPAA